MTTTMRVKDLTPDHLGSTVTITSSLTDPGIRGEASGRFSSYRSDTGRTVRLTLGGELYFAGPEEEIEVDTEASS